MMAYVRVQWGRRPQAKAKSEVVDATRGTDSDHGRLPGPWNPSFCRCTDTSSVTSFMFCVVDAFV